MADVTENEESVVQCQVRGKAHKRAKLAAGLAGKTMIDFLSDAATAAANAVLKQHGLKLSDETLSSAASRT